MMTLCLSGLPQTCKGPQSSKLHHPAWTVRKCYHQTGPGRR
jgi:hypothetical protein